MPRHTPACVCCTSGSAVAAGEGAPTTEAKCAQQAIKLLSEFLSGYYRLSQAKPESVSSAQAPDLPSSSPGSVPVLATVSKGAAPVDTSAAMGRQLPFEQDWAVPTLSSVSSEPAAWQQADLASARGNGPAAIPPMGSDCSRISSCQQVQRQHHTTEASSSTLPLLGQTPTAPEACSPSASKGKDALQHVKAGNSMQQAQHATWPSIPTDPTSPEPSALEAQCAEMWRQSCSCLLPQVSQQSQYHNMPSNC